MQFQEFAPVALIQLTVQPLIPFGQIILLRGLAKAQVANATNGNIIVGNFLPVTTGIQTASPVNVNA